jgi:hypothetical protein
MFREYSHFAHSNQTNSSLVTPKFARPAPARLGQIQMRIMTRGPDLRDIPTPLWFTRTAVGKSKIPWSLFFQTLNESWPNSESSEHRRSDTSPDDNTHDDDQRQQPCFITVRASRPLRWSWPGPPEEPPVDLCPFHIEQLKCAPRVASRCTNRLPVELNPKFGKKVRDFLSGD